MTSVASTAQTSSEPAALTRISSAVTPVVIGVHAAPLKCSATPPSPTTHRSSSLVPEIDVDVTIGTASATQPMRAQPASDAPHDALHASGPASSPSVMHVPSGGEPSQSSGPLTMPSPQRPTQLVVSNVQNAVQASPSGL